jgi:hypothetical protein
MPQSVEPSTPAETPKKESFLTRHKLVAPILTGIFAMAGAGVGGWLAHGSANVTAGATILSSELQALTSKTSRCYPEPVGPICRAASTDYLRRLRQYQ